MSQVGWGWHQRGGEEGVCAGEENGQEKQGTGGMRGGTSQLQEGSEQGDCVGVSCE